MSLHENKVMNVQRNRIITSEINVHIYCQVNFDYGTKNTHWGRK